jgi:hypothetical protein
MQDYNMSEDISSLIEKLEQINTVPVTEAKGHLDHPEDLIFTAGSSGAQAALRSILATVQNPKTVTIKWDGYPALIFGRDSAGRFSIMDKHMFNKAGGVGRTIYTPQQFAKYDVDRGVVRSDLTKIIGSIWAGLERATPKQPGYYWGDLLFSSPLQAQDGMYTFRANPNGITYTVEQDSELGKLFDKKVAGIAVHQFIEADAMSTDDAVTLNGGIGSLQNVSNVAIVPSAMPNPPKLKLNTTLSKAAEQAIQTYGPMVDDLFNSAPQARTAFAGLFTVYVNKRIVAGNLNSMGSDFLQFVQSRPFTETMKAKLLAYLPTKKNEVKAAFIIWVQLYKLKMLVVDQLAKQAEVGPIKGYLQDGTQTQEGFVSNNLKFVDRMGFSRQNLAGR